MRITLDIDTKELTKKQISDQIDKAFELLKPVFSEDLQNIKLVGSDKKEEIEDSYAYHVCQEEKARPGCSFYIQFTKDEETVYRYTKCTIIDYDHLSKKYLVAVNPSKSFMPARDGGYLWVSANQLYERTGRI